MSRRSARRRPWRKAHPRTTWFWRALDNAVKRAIRGGQRVTLGNVAAECENGNLYVTLPSSRRLAYPEARLTPGKFDVSVDVVFKDNARGGWTEVRAWFGATLKVFSASSSKASAATVSLRAMRRASR